MIRRGVCALFICQSLCSAGELADLHRKLVRPRERDAAAEQERFDRAMDPKHGVTEIGLERTPCYGTCPVYTVIIKNDGTFRYQGGENTKRRGKHTGTVDVSRFNALAEFLLESGYMQLESAYTLRVTDMPTAYTAAVVNGKRKIVSNYGGVGPAKLWAVEQLIDKLLLEAEWDG